MKKILIALLLATVLMGCVSKSEKIYVLEVKDGENTTMELINFHNYDQLIIHEYTTYPNGTYRRKEILNINK